MHKYENIQNLWRTQHIRFSYSKYSSHSFFPNKTWDMQICTFKFVSQSGFLNTVCDFLSTLSRSLSRMCRAQNQPAIRLPGSRVEMHAQKKKALISGQKETLTLYKKRFCGGKQNGACSRSRCATFSILWYDEWHVRAHGSMWNRNISGIFTCISHMAVY